MASTGGATGTEVEIDGLDRSTGESQWKVHPTAGGDPPAAVNCVATSGRDRVVCLAALGFGDAGPASLLSIDADSGKVIKTVELAVEDGPWQLVEGADDDAFVVGGQAFTYVTDATDLVEPEPSGGPATLLRYAGAELQVSWSKEVTAPGGADSASSVYVVSIGHGTLLQYDSAGWSTIDARSGAQKGRRDGAGMASEVLSLDLRTDSTIIEYDPRTSPNGFAAYDLSGHERWSAPDLRYLAARGVWQDGPVLAEDTQQHQLVALDPESGDELWRQESTEEDSFVVVNSDGLLLLAEDLHAVQSRDPGNGDSLWSATLDAASIYDMYLSPEHVYLLVGGELHGLDRDTGREVWSRPVGSDVLVAAGDDLVLAGDGSLVLLR